MVEPALVQAMYPSDATSVGRVVFSGTVNIVLIAVTGLVDCLRRTAAHGEKAQERAKGEVFGSRRPAASRW